MVDDQAPVLFSYTVILQREGYDVTGAATSDSACQELDRSSYDLLICDLGLEAGRNGFEVIDYARRRHPRMKPVLLTGFAGPEVEEKAEQRGVTLLCKPVGVPHLLDTLRSLTGLPDAA